MPKTKWGSVIFTAYKFFDSKALLFFAVLEDIHTEGFAVAQHSLQGNAAESLLRRLPQDILSTHYHDNEGHIRALPEESGLCPRGGTALAAAGRGLILTVSHQNQIGQLYPQVLSLLVHGACRELF